MLLNPATKQTPLSILKKVMAESRAPFFTTLIKIYPTLVPCALLVSASFPLPNVFNIICILNRARNVLLK